MSMSTTEPTNATSIEMIEQKFLCLGGAGAGGGAFDLGDLLGSLSALNDWKAIENRDQCYLVLQQYLVDRHDIASLVSLLKMRAEWLGDVPAYRDECRDVLTSATRDRMALAKIESVMGGNARPSVALKQLELLNALVPGVSCVDKTWGYGVVKRLDDFYKRIVVDFDRKPGHLLAMSFAAQTLKVVDGNHILSVQHANPAEFAQKCASDAGEIVLLAIRSYGSMSVLQLQNEMENGILPPNLEWKNFWAAARRQLKGNPGIQIPPASKKSELIELMEGAVPVESTDMMDALAKSNDVPVLMNRMAEFIRTTYNGELTEQQHAVLANRLAFVLKATATTHSDHEKVRALIMARRFGFEHLAVDMRAHMDEEFVVTADGEVDILGTLCKPTIVLNAANKLSTAMVQDLVGLLPVDTNEQVGADLAEVLAEMPYSLVDNLLPKAFATQSASKGVFEAKLSDLMQEVSPPYPILLWICRKQNDSEVAGLVDASSVTTKALMSLEPEVMGETLRLQHNISKIFRDEKWLKGQMARMTMVERSAFYERFRGMDGIWEPMHKRMMEKALLKNFPDLVQETQPEVVEAGAMDLTPLTSFRSLNERQERYRVLVEEQIPQNVRDIEVARGYGDLRENFEYQTARDQQRILMQQQAEMMRDLQNMKGTDFSNIEFTGQVAMGTEVSITFADGHGATYQILGDWDSDLNLGIISRSSLLAKSLIGHREGDNVQIPGEEDGELVDVKIHSVQPLSHSIMEWAQGR